MKDPQSAESKKKIKFLHRFYFSSYGHFCLFLFLIFDEFFTMTQKIKNRVKTDEKGGGVCISLVGKNPIDDHISKAENWIYHYWRRRNLSIEISSRLKIFFVYILSVRHYVCRHFVRRHFMRCADVQETWSLFSIRNVYGFMKIPSELGPDSEPITSLF